MMHEVASMRHFDVFEEIPISSLPPNTVHTAIATRWVRRWKGDLVRSRRVCRGFAETVQLRDTDKQTAKLTPMWELGLWLGRDALANEVLVATPTGAKLARRVRRLVPSEKYSKALFDTAQGTPWSLRGDGVFQPLTTAQLPAQAGGVPSAQADAGTPQTSKRCRGTDFRYKDWCYCRWASSPVLTCSTTSHACSQTCTPCRPCIHHQT